MMIQSKIIELAWKHHFLIKVLEIFRHSRPANYSSGPIWPKFDLVRYVMYVLVTCKYKKDRIEKKNENRWRHHFLYYKPMGGGGGVGVGGAFCCHGNQKF